MEDWAAPLLQKVCESQGRETGENCVHFISINDLDGYRIYSPTVMPITPRSDIAEYKSAIKGEISLLETEVSASGKKKSKIKSKYNLSIFLYY